MSGTVHDITTKVFKTEFWIWHYMVLMYDDKDYEAREMSRPMDVNGVNIMSHIGTVKDWEFIGSDYNMTKMELSDFGEEVSMEEIMLPENLDVRTAIKNKQEQFYQLPF